METPTIATRSLSVVECAGTARDRGRAHGEELRWLIREGIDRWTASIASTQGGDPDRYLTDFLASTGYLATITAWTPALLDEIHGIAEGADQPFERVMVYNLLDEEWAHAKARRHPAPACTVACVRPGGGSAPVMAQTMDIPSLHDGTQAVLRLQPEEGLEALVFTYAGMIGLNGCNEAGVGVVVNNLEMLSTSPHGLPVACIVRGVLEQTTLEAATAFLHEVPHAIGQHYAIGSPEGFASLEGSAGGVIPNPVEADRLLHTNHPLVSTDLVGDPEPAFARSRTRERYAYLCEVGPTLDGQAAVEQVLVDTSVPVSLAPGSGFMTFGAISMELTVPPRLRVAPGPPHDTPFVEVPFPSEVD